jgi:hypothetical protein
MVINDPKEREHYALKPCCNNCQHKRRYSPTWPFNCHWCVAKKKHMIHDLNYNTGCKLFKAVLTPEEHKEWFLRLNQCIKKMKNG